MNKDASQTKRSRGFKRAANLMGERINAVSQQRGFAVSRLLTHWEEIAGSEIASISRPVEVSYGKGGFGAALCLLTTGANAPVLEMQKTKLREKVNAVYGYNAISSIRITQTHATGFAEGQVDFQHRKQKAVPSAPDPAVVEEVKTRAAVVGNEGLRLALEALGQNVLSKHKR
ncbi:DUF721 domain-containing protein [Lentibacter sp. XHP0401]|uniref:DUF721 domain-containing protein n=1 Tax=Lentibacter sp. XHP0401 TaxID=2984334 RepID=UPI0021E87492|nr:DciA family protein [Lentibacter sp. XHP0401]MCV2892695.1 DciA family protein [Lentibacter sp. XHP0401]